MPQTKDKLTAAEVLKKHGMERPDFSGEPSWESRPRRRKKRGERGRDSDKRERDRYDNTVRY